MCCTLIFPKISENVAEIEIRLLRHNGLNLIEYTSDLFALVVLKFDELR